MPPPDNSALKKVPNPPEENQPLQGDDPAPPAEPQNLGILFIAAAIALAVLLGIIGLLAFAAMSRAEPEGPRWALSDKRRERPADGLCQANVALASRSAIA